MPNEHIVLKSNPATNFDALVQRAGNYQARGNDWRRPPFQRDEARKILWSLGTFQEDKGARTLFMALHDSLQAY